MAAKPMVHGSMIAASWLILTAAAGAAPATITVDAELRTGPGTTYAATGMFRAGTTVEVSACSRHWCAVSYGDVQGYVKVNQLRPTAPQDAGFRIPRIINLGTDHWGDIVGLQFSTIGAGHSYEGGYNPPRRRLSPPEEDQSGSLWAGTWFGGLSAGNALGAAPPPPEPSHARRPPPRKHVARAAKRTDRGPPCPAVCVTPAVPAGAPVAAPPVAESAGAVSAPPAAGAASNARDPARPLASGGY
ncbi:SH3 domain-containing protein [Xanthobacteraceae bacterium Astr-EGSB]|uniref:SH3 domain-containing protein n=1 Tax=Astrobacterium formosum TaxID=3069710 RepID=UPI0027AE9230|nr:SH3 domain-containing protein [Xanthobacteraceae bacterium Astr-EGSB]